MFYKLTTVLLMFLSLAADAQMRFDTLNWRPPVDIPIYLSGNFAELRTDHFHAGIDIKTQGKEGFRVYAVQNGYISRIKVSAGGYGTSLYINHNDGYTSVYGHLKEYNIQIDKYVRQIQYERQSFEVDIFPEKGELPVNKGDIIGLTGDTGSSAGPHLHFEIRDTRNAHPMNGLFLGYDIKDNIPPKMEYLYVYPQNNYSAVNGKNQSHYYGLMKKSGHFALRSGDTIKAAGKVGLGLKVNDYLNGSYNRCGVYELKAYINDTLFFHDKFDGFSFAETRNINSLMDYKENVDKGRKLHKLYVEPNNKLSVYIEALNRGILSITEGSGTQKVTIVANDAYFNSSSLTFFIEYEEYKGMLASDDSKIIIPWQNRFNLDTLGLQLYFKEASFYDTLKMDFAVDTTRLAGSYSPIYHIHNRYTPVQKRFEVAIKYDSVVDSLKNKLLLGIWKKEKFFAAGGKVDGDYIKGSVRKLGAYAVVIDTVKPTIVPLGNLAKSNDLSLAYRLQFKINDDFSGVASYKGTINGNWVLYSYDAKNDLITYYFDKYMPHEGIFEVKVEVEDKRGNIAIYKKECKIYPEQYDDIGQ